MLAKPRIFRHHSKLASQLTKAHETWILERERFEPTLEELVVETTCLWFQGERAGVHCSYNCLINRRYATGRPRSVAAEYVELPGCYDVPPHAKVTA